MLFFKLKDKLITDVSVAVIDKPDPIHGYKQLYDIIEQYVRKLRKKPKYIHWLKSGGKAVTIHAFIKGIEWAVHSGVVG